MSKRLATCRKCGLDHPSAKPCPTDGIGFSIDTAFKIDDYWGPLEVTYNDETDDYTIAQGDQVIFITAESLKKIKETARYIQGCTP